MKSPRCSRLHMTFHCIYLCMFINNMLIQTSQFHLHRRTNLLFHHSGPRAERSAVPCMSLHHSIHLHLVVYLYFCLYFYLHLYLQLRLPLYLQLLLQLYFCLYLYLYLHLYFKNQWPHFWLPSWGELGSWWAFAFPQQPRCICRTWRLVSNYILMLMLMLMLISTCKICWGSAQAKLKTLVKISSQLGKLFNSLVKLAQFHADIVRFTIWWENLIFESCW